MGGVRLLKAAIRTGMCLVPNRLLAYRLVSGQGHRWIRLPRDLNVLPCDSGTVRGQWLSHSRLCQPRVVLYFHGGGYAIGSNATHVGLCSEFAMSAQAQIFMLDYRLAPENPFPAAIDDAEAAWHYLLRSGVAPDRIVLAGDSAGGGLALATAMRLRDAGGPMPAAVVAFSPWLDLSCEHSGASIRLSRDPMITPERLAFFARQYAGSMDLRHPHISPYHGELKGLPPILIQSGSDEILACEAEAFATKARQAGAQIAVDIWEDMFHVWHFAAAWLPEGRSALQKAGQFVQQHVPVFWNREERRKRPRPLQNAAVTRRSRSGSRSASGRTAA